MNNLLVAIAVFIITVVGAMFAVPYFVDWNTYRSNFEEEASRVIGREVQVDGDVTLHLLPTPYFRLEKVRIADASADLTFFKADSLSIKLSVPPIFRGIIEAHEIEFQRPVVRLAIDAKDNWNWQSFASALDSAGYMPANVTLTSLKIVEGVLAVHGPDGLERTRLQGVNGELSAPSLQGPYRFRGSFLSGGAERDLRFVTSTPEQDGGVKLRASLRLMDTGATYLLDGRAVDLMAKPRLDGDLTARLPISGLWQPAARPSPSARRASAKEEEHKLETAEAAFDLKATVKADAAGAQLSDLALSFEQGGRPQIVTGSVQASWRNELALQMSLSSRWLDLDRVTDSADGAGPVESIAKFAARLRDFAPGRKTQMTLSLEQGSLGNEAVGPLQLVLKRSDEKLDIEDLRVALPGGTRAELQGSISDTAQSVVFNGRLALRGTSVVRFLNWATVNTVPIEPRADGVFGLRAQVTADEGRLAAREIVGNLSGTTLTGTAQYRWQGTPELQVALEGPQVDARAFVPAGASLADVYQFVLGGSETKQADGQAPTKSRPVWGIAQADLSLRLSAGQLATTGRVYRDVTAAMELKGGHVRQLQLRASGDEGYKLDVEGAVDDARTRPKGNLRGLAVVNAPSGVEPLAELFGTPIAFRPSGERAKAMVPLRLAGSMAFGGRSATSRDLVLDGAAGGAPVKVNARFDGGSDGWRRGPAEITATIDAPDGAKLANLLVPGTSAATTKAGRLLVKAAGAPADGMMTIASWVTGDGAISFRGHVATTEAGLKSTGEVDLRVADGGPLLALGGFAPVIRFDGVPISGRLALTVEDGKVALEKLATTVGENRVGGYIRLSGTAERRRIDASLDLDELRLPQLLAPVLDQRMAIAGVAEATVSGRQSVWPDEPFGVEAFDGFDGNVAVSARRFILGDGLALSHAKLSVALGPGRIELSELTGTGLGGEVRGKLVLSKAPAGAEARGELALTAALEAFGKGPQQRAAGPIKATLEFTGRGLSPRSLVSALQGRGQIAFGEAKLDALWPGAIALAADAGLKGEPDKLSAIVRRTLTSGLSSGGLSLADKTIPIELSEGLLRARSLAFEVKEGRVAGGASVDLRALTFDSHWRLEGTTGVSSSGGKPLPGVTVSYSGPLAALGEIEPRIDAVTLEQEVSARKIERDVEELERLRRLDEQRRLMEAERLRKQFEQTPPVQRPAQPSAAPVTPSSREARPVAPPG